MTACGSIIAYNMINIEYLVIHIVNYVGIEMCHWTITLAGYIYLAIYYSYVESVSYSSGLASYILRLHNESPVTAVTNCIASGLQL